MGAILAHAPTVGDFGIFETKNWFFIPWAKWFELAQIFDEVEVKIFEAINVNVGVMFYESILVFEI